MGLVIVSGLPGSGKTTLGEALANVLGVPFVCKDRMKAALFDAVDLGDAGYDVWGPLTVELGYQLARRLDEAVLDMAFHRSRAVGVLRELVKPTVEVHCKCPADVARPRYEERIRLRHRSHLDAFAGDAQWELWSREMGEPLLAEARRLEVDTTRPVDVSAVAGWVRGIWA